VAKLMLLLRCSLGSTAMGRNEKVCAREVRRITGAVEKVEEQCHPLNGLNFSQVRQRLAGWHRALG